MTDTTQPATARVFLWSDSSMNQANQPGGLRCHDADACAMGQLPCPTPKACNCAPPATQPARECLQQSAEVAREIMRFNVRGGLINPESRGMYVRYEDHVAALQSAPPAPAGVAVPAEVDLPDVEDMAHSAVQEALSYGVNHDVFHRWMRAVMDKTVQALAVAPAQAVPESHTKALEAIATCPVADIRMNAAAANMRGIAQRALAARAQAVAVPEGWRWMTHPDRNNGQPIPVRIEVEDGVTYYRPFDERGTDFEWDKRGDEWVEIAAPAQEHATQLAGQGQDVPQIPPRWLSDQCGGEYDDMTSGQGYRKGWNDCRDAMRAAAPAQAQEDARDAEAIDTLAHALEMFVGTDALHSLCVHEPMDVMGRVKGTWSAAAEANARAALALYAQAIDAARAAQGGA